MSTGEALSFHEIVARRAEARPDDEVLRLAGSSGWTAGELWQHSLSIAGGLGRLVGAGDTVTTCLPPGPYAIAVTTVLSALGAVEMPVSPDVDPRWARTLATVTGRTTVVATGQALAASLYLAGLGCHRTVPVVTVDSSGVGAVPDELVAAGRTVSPRRRAAEGAPTARRSVTSSRQRRRDELG